MTSAPWQIGGLYDELLGSHKSLFEMFASKDIIIDYVMAELARNNV